MLWPLWRSARWEDPGIAQKRDQLLFFVWWSLEQRSLTNPDAAPASKRHLWPLLSTWDNGAGRRQILTRLELPASLPYLFSENNQRRGGLEPGDHDFRPAKGAGVTAKENLTGAADAVAKRASGRPRARSASSS